MGGRPKRVLLLTVRGPGPSHCLYKEKLSLKSVKLYCSSALSLSCCPRSRAGETRTRSGPLLPSSMPGLGRVLLRPLASMHVGRGRGHHSTAVLCWGFRAVEQLPSSILGRQGTQQRQEKALDQLHSRPWWPTSEPGPCLVTSAQASLAHWCGELSAGHNKAGGRKAE